MRREPAKAGRARPAEGLAPPAGGGSGPRGRRSATSAARPAVHNVVGTPTATAENPGASHERHLEPHPRQPAPARAVPALRSTHGGAVLAAVHGLRRRPGRPGAGRRRGARGVLTGYRELPVGSSEAPSDFSARMP